jgi:hypothetical protein
MKFEEPMRTVVLVGDECIMLCPPTYTKDVQIKGPAVVGTESIISTNQVTTVKLETKTGGYNYV